MNLQNKRIVVTGGAGFLGQNVVKKLKDIGCENIFIPRSKDYNLIFLDNVKKMYDDMNPDIVIHLAANVGGIGANLNNPGSFFYNNLMMGTQLIEEGRLRNIEKFVAIGTICSYPKFTPVPFKEESLWNGYPEETNAPYGLAKKMMLVQSQAYREQYNFNSIFLIPVNLYGKKDNFNEETSHVIPAIIKKCVDAIDNKKKQIECWGSGSVTREFLYVEDAANAIVMATKLYNESDPVNIGSGKEISIKDLVTLIAKITKFDGEIVWDTSMPDGQPRRLLDVSVAKNKFGFESKVDFEQGLKNTIEWYLKNKL